MQINKKTAMTYIELIMVMGIIGVVAAVSLPALKKHSQKTELATLAKKSYYNLEEAVDNAILTEGPIRNWDFSNDSTFCKKYLEANMNILQNSGASGSSIIARDGMRYTVIECDGKYCAVVVDVNGPKIPNQRGKDQFSFYLCKSKTASGVCSKYDAEKIILGGWGGIDLLRENGWRFTDKLWRCKWDDSSEEAANKSRENCR